MTRHRRVVVEHRAERSIRGVELLERMQLFGGKRMGIVYLFEPDTAAGTEADGHAKLL